MSRSGDASADLLSEALVRSYVDENPRFVERPWLADLIEDKLADPGCRFLLLTGEPGSGKSALVAWLARQNRDWPRYFIRRDSQMLLNSGDARPLLFALGHQLAALRPRVFHPDRLEVVVRQHVREVAPGGRVVGLKVEDLEVSPFYKTALRVEQEAGLVAGELAGIEAGRIVAEARFLELGNLQYLSLLDPAAVLLREEPDVRLVLLVDALDELRYHAGRESALDWLAACPELPPNVRFLLTSRPDKPLLELFRRRQGEWLREVAIDSDSDQLTGDLTRYATSFVTEPKVAAVLEEQQIAQEEFLVAAVTHAEGNFQYLAALFRGIDHTLAAPVHAETRRESERRAELRRLLRLEEVPAGLGELYSFFLTLIRDAVAGERVEVPGAQVGEREHVPAWEGLYQPVLGVLAVAYEPLTAGQIASFGAIKTEERWLRGALSRLTQFLDHKDGRYRLYHASFPEYLTAAETHESHPDDYLDPTEWHRTIVGSYRRSTADWNEVPWEEVDDYGLLHVADHLATLTSEGERSEYAAELDALLCRRLMRAKRARFGSHQPFDHDVQASIAVALADHDSAALVREVRGRYLHALLGTLAAAVPLDALYALARADEYTRAVMLADLLPAGTRAAGYLLIAGGTAAAGHRSEAELLAEQALAMLPELPSAPPSLPERLDAALRGGAPEPTLAGALDVAHRALTRPDDRADADERSAPMEGEGERGVTERARELLGLLPPDAANAVTAGALSASNATAEALVDAVESAVPAMAARGGYERFPPVAEWFQALAQLLLLVGDHQRIRVALAPALGLHDEVYGDHVQVWAAWARTCAAVGYRAGIDRILDVINGETDNTFREQALWSVAAPMAAAADQEALDRFEQIARTLDPAFAAPSAVVARLARSLAETGRVAEAGARASDLVARLEAAPDDPEIRVALLVAMAKALADVGRGDAVAAVCRSAVPLTDRFVEMTGASTGVSFEGMGDRTIALADLACTLAASGHLDMAWEVAQSSLAAASRNLERRRFGLVVGQRVASAFAEAGDAERTIVAIKMATEAADGNDTHVVAAELAAYVAPTLHRRGQRDVATQLLEDARNVATELADRRTTGDVGSEDSDALLGEVAVGLAGAERLHDAMEAFGEIEDPFTRAAALQAAAGECEADTDASMALLTRSLELMGTISRRVDEVDVLAGAARGYARCGRTDLALDTSRNALDAVLGIDEQFRARPLGRIAEAAAGAGADAIVEATLRQALELLEQSGRSDALQSVVRGVAAAHARPLVTRVTSELPLMTDRELATDLTGYVIDALVNRGDTDEALRLWHELLADERLNTLEQISRVLVRGVRAIAHVDDGSSLMALHDRLSAIRAWWDERGNGPVRRS